MCCVLLPQNNKLPDNLMHHITGRLFSETPKEKELLSSQTDARFHPLLTHPSFMKSWVSQVRKKTVSEKTWFMKTLQVLGNKTLKLSGVKQELKINQFRLRRTSTGAKIYKGVSRSGSLTITFRVLFQTSEVLNDSQFLFSGSTPCFWYQ